MDLSAVQCTVLVGTVQYSTVQLEDETRKIAIIIQNNSNKSNEDKNSNNNSILLEGRKCNNQNYCNNIERKSGK